MCQVVSGVSSGLRCVRSSKVCLPSGPFIDSIAGVPEEFRHVVWTAGMRRLAVLVGRALHFGESVLLVGDTG